VGVGAATAGVSDGGAGVGALATGVSAGVADVRGAVARAGVVVSALTSLCLPPFRPFLPFLRRCAFISSASLRRLSATSSHGFSPRAIFSSKTLWSSGLHCSQKY
jgi:hypothetical protein